MVAPVFGRDWLAACESTEQAIYLPRLDSGNFWQLLICNAASAPYLAIITAVGDAFARPTLNKNKMRCGLDEFGLLSLLPTAVVISIALMTHRPVAALLAGVVVGILLLSPSNVIGTLSEITLQVMQDETIGWVIMVSGLMGSLIYLLIQSGGASAFAAKMATKAKTRNKSLLVTWMLGMVMFIDDYLNAIAIGNSMKKVTDKFNVSRAMLSYVVDSTAAPTCVIVPISTWAVYFAGVLEASDVAEVGGGMMMYISGIPFMFYPFIALILVPFVATGKFPLIGPMKAAEMPSVKM